MGLVDGKRPIINCLYQLGLRGKFLSETMLVVYQDLLVGDEFSHVTEHNVFHDLASYASQ